MHKPALSAHLGWAAAPTAFTAQALHPHPLPLLRLLPLHCWAPAPSAELGVRSSYFKFQAPGFLRPSLTGSAVSGQRSAVGGHWAPTTPCKVIPAARSTPICRRAFCRNGERRAMTSAACCPPLTAHRFRLHLRPQLDEWLERSTAHCSPVTPPESSRSTPLHHSHLHTRLACLQGRIGRSLAGRGFRLGHCGVEFSLQFASDAQRAPTITTPPSTRRRPIIPSCTASRRGV